MTRLEELEELWRKFKENRIKNTSDRPMTFKWASELLRSRGWK